MIKLAHIPRQKMTVRRRPSNFIQLAVQERWQTKSGKSFAIAVYLISSLIFFALYFYFNVQWRSIELRWDNDNDNGCSTTMALMDFLADTNSAFFFVIVIFSITLLTALYVKTAAVEPHVFTILTIFSTVSSFVSFATISLYALGNGWNSPNCAESDQVNTLNRHLIFQSLCSVFVNALFITIYFYLHQKSRKLVSSLRDGIRKHPNRIYSISPPEFDIVSAFPPPPPYYATRQTC